MKQETWRGYVQRILNAMSPEDAAAVTGVSAATIYRWIREESSKEPPNAMRVIAFARGFSQVPVQALIAAGYLEPRDIKEGTIEVYQSLEELSDDALLAEIARRFAGHL